MKFLDSLELKDFALFCKRWKIREFAVFVYWSGMG
jgi:hypothetical protein